MLKGSKFEQAVNDVKQIKKTSLVFTALTLIRLGLMNHHNPKFYEDVADYLTRKKVIRQVFRIYSEDKPSQYVDYSSYDKIPFGSYAYYEPTGEEFYVDRLVLPEIFYYFN